MSAISQFLCGRGIQVYCVPEAATLLMTAGVNFANMTRDQVIDAQAELCRIQTNLEDSMFRIAMGRGGKSLILSDRGLMDGKAYLPQEDWDEMLKRNNWEDRELREERYDAVCHLVTAALGAEDSYNSVNNPTRSETLEGARLLEEKLQHAYLGHPHLCMIDNSTDFAGKIQRVKEFICQQVGIPIPSDRKKRYLIKHIPEVRQKSIFLFDFSWLPSEGHSCGTSRFRALESVFESKRYSA